MKQSAQVALAIYLTGAAVMMAYLGWSGVASGGLERHHDFKDGLFLAAIYTATCALWPVMLVLIVLIYFGVIQGPIEL